MSARTRPQPHCRRLAALRRITVAAVPGLMLATVVAPSAALTAPPASGAPSAAVAAPAPADRPAQVAVVGTDGALWVAAARADGTLGAFASRGGGVIATPAVVSVPPAAGGGTGPATYIVTGTDHGLWVRDDVRDWHPLTPPGVYCVDAPAASLNTDARTGRLTLSVACRGRDSALWWGQAPVTAGVLPWVPAWRSLGGVLTTAPALAAVAGGALTFFATPPDGYVWTRTGSSGWERSGWRCSGGITAAAVRTPAAPSGVATVFACRGRDGALWLAESLGGGWLPAFSPGGRLVGAPAVAVMPQGTGAYVEGLDAAVWGGRFAHGTAPGWSGWARSGGVVRYGAAAAALLTAGDVPPVTGVLPPAMVGTEWSTLPTSAKVVALTFDAGSGNQGVAPILSTLAGQGVPATFFLTGAWADRYPADARAIAARHPVGNHTFNHPDLATLDEAGVRDQVLRGTASITAATGVDPHPLFRFPYGSRTPALVTIVNNMGFGSIRWTVDTLGWEGTTTSPTCPGGQTTGSVVQRVLSTLRPGAVVLMHVGAACDGTTLDADALPAVIAAIRAAGYGFVTVAQYT